VSYLVKDVFLSLQGEGLQAGRRAAFVRFAGCNLWNGDPMRRVQGRAACAMWCDTDFRAEGAKRYETRELVGAVVAAWALRPTEGRRRFVVLTGGEPLLQVDRELVAALRAEGFEVAAETNGTVPLPRVDLDWLSVSPKLLATGKGMAELAVEEADELKVVLPGVLQGPGWTDELLFSVGTMRRWRAKLVVPQDPVILTMLGRSQLCGGCFATREYEANVSRCVSWVKENDTWRLGLQLHKLAGLP
jgi:7-carboxy-7-deazaguanine synthase